MKPETIAFAFSLVTLTVSGAALFQAHELRQQRFYPHMTMLGAFDVPAQGGAPVYVLQDEETGATCYYSAWPASNIIGLEEKLRCVPGMTFDRDPCTCASIDWQAHHYPTP